MAQEDRRDRRAAGRHRGEHRRGHRHGDRDPRPHPALESHDLRRDRRLQEGLARALERPRLLQAHRRDARPTARRDAARAGEGLARPGAQGHPARAGRGREGRPSLRERDARFRGRRPEVPIAEVARIRRLQVPGHGVVRHHEGSRRGLGQPRLLSRDGAEQEHARLLHLSREARAPAPRQVVRARREEAGGVRGTPYRVMPGPVTGLPIPVDAEIVIEGFADGTDKMPEGPFGEWTGYYASGEREEPVMRVEAIYHRNDPIILASPPNVPPDEQSFYRAFMRSARLRGDIEAASIPGITGVWCHEVGGSRLLNAISITQKYAGHARQVGHAAATVHSGAYLGRYTIVVDDDIDVMDLEEVLWAMCTRSDPSESIDIIPRMWSGPLDPRIHPDRKGLSSRAIIDATRPWEWRDKFPRSQLPTPETRRRAMEKWGWLVGKGDKPAK